MQNYNLIHSVDDISNEDNLEGSGVLTSDFFPVVTAGIPTITITELIDATIVGLWREDAPWEEVDEAVTLTDKTYHFDETTGDIEFFTDLNTNEKIYVLWYTGSAPVTYDEPVTLDEIKNYLRLEGYGSDDGLSYFNFDDSLLEDMGIAARELVEKWNGISIVTKIYRAELTNCAGEIEIPYPPVNAISSFVDVNGDAITDYVLRTGKFPKIKSPRHADLTIEYITGYTAVPKALKVAILQQVAYMYEHRGEEKDFELCAAAINTSSAYNRNTWLA